MYILKHSIYISIQSLTENSIWKLAGMDSYSGEEGNFMQKNSGGSLNKKLSFLIISLLSLHSILLIGMTEVIAQVKDNASLRNSIYQFRISSPPKPPRQPLTFPQLTRQEQRLEIFWIQA